MKTTKANFDLFKKECQKWEKLFNLDGWKINYYWKKYEPDDSIGRVKIGVLSRSIAVILNIEVDDELPIDIPLTAKHEMIHCLLGAFSELSWQRFVTLDEVAAAEEELVCKLMKIIKCP